VLNLWRKIIELFRKYPILWVPYICADLAASGLTSLRHLAGNAIFHWVATRHLHSVLGGDLVTTNPDSAVFKKAMLLAAPLGWATDYVNACLYIAALVLTAALVVTILRSEKPSAAAALPTLRTYLKRILIYALIFCALTLALTDLILLPTSYLLSGRLERSQILLNGTMLGEQLLSLICTAWIMAPLAIALVRPADAAAVSAERKKLGRIAAMLAGAVTIVLEELSALLIIRHVRFSHFGLAVFNPVNSLVVNSPLILLFIALAVIAAEDPLEIRNGSNPRTPRLLETLMPLHFRPGREP
jgi:hypothetical protein